MGGYGPCWIGSGPLLQIFLRFSLVEEKNVPGIVCCACVLMPFLVTVFHTKVGRRNKSLETDAESETRRNDVETAERKKNEDKGVSAA